MEYLTELEKLVESFEADFDIYKHGNVFNEQMTRQQYIDNFLKYLGWDISNPRNLSFNDREIVAEEFSESNKRDRPDYTIRSNGISKFYVEAKKVSVDILTDIEPTLQARRYGWNSNHKISVLTNFEYLIILLTYEMPKKEDTASTYRYKCYHYSEYIEKFDEIYHLLSRESMVNGTFDQWTDLILPEDATKSSLDFVFLEQLNKWRVQIGNDLFNNSEYSLKSIKVLNDEIQEFLNQIIFLRFAEDNHYVTTDLLKEEILSQDDYISYFRKLDKKYNSVLFKNASIISKISNDLLKSIIEGLYFPKVSYDFSIIDLSILSKVYENFLQEELVLEEDEIVLRPTKAASVKAVVSTPDSVVVAMIKRVLSEKLNKKSPDEILELRIADLAVGSGIFLIEAYNYIENYLTQWFAEKNNVVTNSLLVPFQMKRDIIQNVLVGFDINNQAVQLTRFSLLLRILSHEGKERIELIKPILPSLEKNIRCGNSLVTMDNLGNSISIADLFEINPISDDVFSQKFDVIIGNPPYLSKEDIINSTPIKEVSIYDKRYRSTVKQYDKYMLFIEKSLNVIKSDGDIILLVPNKFFTIEAGKGLRTVLKEKLFLKKIFDFRYTQIFPSVTNYVSIIHLSYSNIFEYVVVSEAKEVYENKSGLGFSIKDLSEESWFLTDDASLKRTYNFAKANFPSIESELIPKNGVQTSKNNVYIIPKNKTVEIDGCIFFNKNGSEYRLEKSMLKEFCKPSGKIGGQSFNMVSANCYIIFPYKNGKIIEEDTLKNDYPETYRYLLDHKNVLLPKSEGGSRDVRGAGDEILWYQFGRAQFLKEVDQPKLIVGVMSNQPNFNIDKNNLVYASGGTAGYIGLFLKEDSQYTLEYMQAWLSHEFTDRIFQTIGSSFEGEFYTHGTALYKDIPLLPIDFNSKIEVEKFKRINQVVKEINNLNYEIENQSSTRLKNVIISRKKSLINQVNAEIDDLLKVKMRK